MTLISNVHNEMQGHAKITISSEKNEMKAYDLDKLTKMKSQ